MLAPILVQGLKIVDHFEIVLNILLLQMDHLEFGMSLQLQLQHIRYKKLSSKCMICISAGVKNVSAASV